MVCNNLWISIHALREEGDTSGSRFRPSSRHFYPRPPRGGRRPHSRRRCRRSSNFYPRPPRGGRPHAGDRKNPRSRISIHALREEGDRLTVSPMLGASEFLSTPSARRATVRTVLCCQCNMNFYPRPPRGGRQQKRRKTSPLLFHYKTICTDLEELVQKHPKKQL